MPENYTPPGSDVTYVVPALGDPADGPHDFRQFADSIPASMSTAIPVKPVATDYTVGKDDVGCLLAVDTSSKNILVTVPVTTDTDFPIGSVVTVSNVGTSRSGRVTVVGASGVTLKDTRDRDVPQYRMKGLMKTAENFWLIVAGSGDSGKAKEPLPPQNVAAFGTPGGALVTWNKPADDGGSPVTLYKVEQLVGADWTTVATVEASVFSTEVDGLTVGTEYSFRALALNAVGASEPSPVVKATPTKEYNEATGGTVSMYEKGGKFFRVHTFKASDKFTVVKASNPFRVLVVGGGGAGAGTPGYGADRSGQWYSHGAGGAGGFIEQAAYVLSAGDHPVTVGGSGKDSVFGTLTAKAGGNGGFIFAAAGSGGSGGGGGVGENGSSGSRQGGSGTDGQGFAGGTPVGQEGGGGGGAGGPGAGEGTVNPGGPGKVSDITGTPVTYATGGYAAGAAYGGDNTGNGGGSIGRVVAPCGAQAGGAGGTGIVVVSYEIAPFNEAVGGDVTDVDNYNGTGQKWRVHTFKSTSELIVKAASKPFRVLCVAGGAGGAGGGPYYGGGGGGGAGGLIFKEEMALGVGTIPVTVGQGGAGGEGAREGAHNGVCGSPGGTSSIAGLQAVGGGGGGAYQSEGQSGGSGGGGYSGRGGYAGTPGQGNDGGPGGNPGGGTGGGAGASGGGGGGGKAVNITGANVTYANGAGCVDSGAGSGAANTGNGGQGTRGGSPQYGGNGGSGVVIVAYQIG